MACALASDDSVFALTFVLMVGVLTFFAKVTSNCHFLAACLMTCPVAYTLGRAVKALRTPRYFRARFLWHAVSGTVVMLLSLWAWSRLVFFSPFALAEWGLFAAFMTAFAVNMMTGIQLLPLLPVTNAVTIQAFVVGIGATLSTGLLLAQKTAIALDLPAGIRSVLNVLSLLMHGTAALLALLNSGTQLRLTSTPCSAVPRSSRVKSPVVPLAQWKKFVYCIWVHPRQDQIAHEEGAEAAAGLFTLGYPAVLVNFVSSTLPTFPMLLAAYNIHAAAEGSYVFEALHTDFVYVSMLMNVLLCSCLCTASFDFSVSLAGHNKTSKVSTHLKCVILMLVILSLLAPSLFVFQGDHGPAFVCFGRALMHPLV
eukprot:TRINITY_DN14226_c0_g2_i2.p1 TRINITY_DN14226_c0_g2~~TRINITY_DN14226_c0_g2_i2.p1  ORF type:complete len:368 (+),score=62.16 TRINITY_DN14226_c0_g2_i2:164-1267(+)